ncbi:MAG: hypothetical protein NC094_05710 [Bacteroidales bacterium]|nr:hypothetical protein [Lachnoclostridium sp.]MCM1384318.1 hypothetical protein [Lachnoclostridium sp.]MCM1464899.1 hypothetical protein [Bacteroidales bacterium]
MDIQLIMDMLLSIAPIAVLVLSALILVVGIVIVVIRKLIDRGNNEE